MFVSGTQTWNSPVNLYQHVANSSLSYFPRFPFLMTLEKHVFTPPKENAQKKNALGGSCSLFSIMPIAITYQAFSMYQALRKAL